MKCRHCNTDLTVSFIDLGSAPPSNAYLSEETLHAPEKWFPLRVLVCANCWLVQTEDFTDATDLFDANYAYFSSFSSTWLAHCERYVADVIKRFCLDTTSHIVEIAANDGYLLQYFRDQGVPCLGVEPTASTAAAARERGIAIIEDFFGIRLADEMVTQDKQADLIVANNVLAHVPDINDFVSGFAVLLKPDGVATFEFPHLMRLVSENQFDTIYHEHFSYLSLHAVKRVLEFSRLSVFDVEEIPTHGGSLRVFAQKMDSGLQPASSHVTELLEREAVSGITAAKYYQNFQSKADKVKNDLLAFLIEAKREGKKVMAYGAAAKGNTLLNYAGVRPDLLPYVVDLNPSKQGKYLPGSRIPIVSEAIILDTRPDYVIVLPWNLQKEVVDQLAYTRKWGAHFVTAVPKLEIF